MVDYEEQRGLSEQPMAGFAPSVESRVAFHRFALVVYGFRCAISGLRFEPSEGALHDRLEVVLIHPRESEGPLEISNVLVLESAVARAFGYGHVCVDDSDRVVIANPEALSDEVRPLVVAGRSLFLPDDPLFRPSRTHLHFHRLVVATYPQD